MNKQEAENLTKSMVQYFCNLLSFEHQEDINITIVDYPDDSLRSNVYTFPEYKTFDLKINISNETGSQETIESQICHELAHIFTSEYFQLMYAIFGNQHCETTEYRQFRMADERVAMRLARIFLYLWDIEQGIEDAIKLQGELINEPTN